MNKIIYIFSNEKDRLTVEIMKYFLEYHLENVVVTSIFDATKEDQAYNVFFSRSAKMAMEADVIISLKPDTLDWGMLIGAYNQDIPILQCTEFIIYKPKILRMIYGFFERQNDLLDIIQGLFISKERF